MRIDKMDLLETFIQTAESNSISKAAEELDVSPGTVSRKLTRLEELLEQSLIRRSTHSVSLTETGEQFMSEAQQLLLQWQRLEEKYQSNELVMTGRLHVVAPEGIGQAFLTDSAIEFQKRYPNLELTWVLQNEPVKFANTSCDLWLRMGDDNNDGLIVRKLALAKRSLVASPDLVKEVRLRGPASVEKLPFVALNTREGGAIQLTSMSSYETITIYPKVAISTNNFFVLHRALLQGVGVGVLPDWYVQRDLESGQLVEVIPNWKAPSLNFNAIVDSSKYQNQRAEAFIEIISSKLKDIPHLRLTSSHTVVSIA